MTALESQQELVEKFDTFDDWMDKYKLLIDLGRALPPFPEELKTEANQVFGCQAQVWYSIELEDGKLQIQATSDALIVSGLIACILEVYNNREPTEILNTEPTFVTDMKLESHLSMTRSNGLRAMLNRVFAVAEQWNN